MDKMKKKFWLLPVLLVMLLTGCLKEDMNQTIVLMGPESDVKPIDSIIPDTLLKFIANPVAMHGSPLYLPKGTTPPDIQGEFMFFERELYAFNSTHPLANDTLFFRFGGDADTVQVTDKIVLHPGDGLIINEDTIVATADTTVQITKTVLCYPNGQHNMMVPCDYKEKSYSGLTIPEAYVMGEGDSFTVYFSTSSEDEESGVKYTLTSGYIITGKITATGIDEAVVACVNDYEVISNPGGVSGFDGTNIFVYRVKTNDASHPFGSAVKQEWYKEWFNH